MSVSDNFLSVQDVKNLTDQFSNQVQRNAFLERQAHAAQESRAWLYGENLGLKRQNGNQMEALEHQTGEIEELKFDVYATQRILDRQDEYAEEAQEPAKMSILKRVVIGAVVGAPYVVIGAWALVNHTGLLG